ncbi:LysE family translocator, partial [Stutzerimonas kunmingensis]
MYWMEFMTVALVHLLAVASPGPDFAVVVRESVTQGRRVGSWTALGVGCGIFVHVAYSLLGIGLIVSQSIVLFNLFKWLAAGYLLYLGWRALRARPMSLDTADEVGTTSDRSPWQAFVVGFVTNG